MTISNNHQLLTINR